MSAHIETADTPPAIPQSQGRSHTLFTSSLRSPARAYAHLELITDPPQPAGGLDNLQVRSYVTAALRQFMGDHGAAVAVDILKVEGRECWLRLPREDVSLFAAAIAAFPGTAVGSGTTGVLRMLACGDWLGSLVGRDGEGKVWSP
ncbi:hypothetical protein NKR19_g3883 [Coniochaeta hoffmannii]|uniref:Ribonucleases P/MRP subunit Pop8-like domain-containing protein n=1 Tax=Coniochaeta hoffmannii TaxID=91930 RepID=A0AA38VKW7_9PEZI|nr:hypothetical protein NKR19_g3883 [Coniochaeta hoffmannii]